MKKIFKLMTATAVALATFTACEDVPEPYNNPYSQYQGGEETVVIDPAGSGTQADPWNVAAIIEACNGLADGSFLNNEAEVYVCGIVTEITEISTQYGNATYYISDDAKGSNRFYVYRGKMLDGKSVENENELEVGDSVVVCGKVKNYKGTMEFDQGNYIVFLKEGEGGPTLETPGTADAPLTVAQALDYINNKLGSATSPEGYVKGKIVSVGEVDTGQYGNATYTISDDGTDATTLQVYRGYSLGGTKFQSANEIKVGDEVIVKGKLVNFKGNTPQFAQGSAIYSLNGTIAGGGNTDVTNIGSKEAPKTVAEALLAINALEKGATTEEFWFIKGKVKQIKTTPENIAQYKNIDYIITDDGNNELTVFRGKNLDNTDFTSADELSVGDIVIVYGQLMKYENKTTTAIVPEVAQGNYIVSKTAGGDTPTPSGEATGDGTLSNPFNPLAAINFTSALAKDAKSENDVYIKGKISRIANNGTFSQSGNYGNASFYISEDGTENNEFYIFRTLYFGNEKYTSGTDIKVGDEVIICGKVTNYRGNTPETSGNESYLYSLNGMTSDGGGDANVASGDGTLSNPFNPLAAINFTSALAEDAKSENNVYIKGKISHIANNGTFSQSGNYGNASFYISGDGTENNEFYIFRTLYFDNQKYTSGTDIKVGDEVIICGKVTNYRGNTPETSGNESYLYSLNGKTSNGGGDTPGGNTNDGNSISIDFSTQGYANAQGVSEVTLTDGTKLTFSGGENTNAPKYYDTGAAVRMYPKNFVTVTANKTISSITITCSANNAEGQVTASNGTVAVNDMTITISSVNNLSTQITNSHTGTGAASQLRISSVTINYAQ